MLKEYFSFKKFLRLSEREREISLIPANFVKEIIVLGPTFIKLGQILSARPDLLPKQFVTALGQLQESVPPFDFDDVKKIINNEFKSLFNKSIDNLTHYLLLQRHFRKYISRFCLRAKKWRSKFSAQT